MKKIKISMTKIKKTKVDLLADAATNMGNAIYGALSIFTGPIPFTLVAILALVTTYKDKKSEYVLGGLLQRQPFLDAKGALISCMLEMGKYVNGIANGNILILDLSTLPTTQDLVDYLALIIAGATATKINGKAGLISGQLITNCDSFGPGVDYFVVLSEGFPLSAGVTISNNGQVNTPNGLTNNVCFGLTKGRKKTFNGLTPQTLYYCYYVLVYGETVGVMSAPVQMLCAI